MVSLLRYCFRDDDVGGIILEVGQCIQGVLSQINYNWTQTLVSGDKYGRYIFPPSLRQFLLKLGEV